MKRKTLPAIVLALTGVLFSPGFPLAQGGEPDGFGYTWVNSVPPDSGTNFSWIEISKISPSPGTNSGVSGDDALSGPISIGFDFPFYGQTFNQLAFSTNGIVTFGGASSKYLLPPIPSTTDPNNFVAVFLADLYVYSDGAIYYQPFPEGLPASADKRPAFVVEWSNVGFWCNPRLAPDKLAACLESRATFEVILFENGEIRIQYGNITGPTNSATVGIENSQGTIGLQYNYNGAGGLIGNEIAVVIVPPNTDTTDTAPPVVTAPADITKEATAPLTPVALGTATAVDLVDGPVPVSSNAPAGGFPVGTTLVTWTAVDSHGNQGWANQQVTVTDTTPPVVTAPADITKEATAPLTPVALGTATAVDLVDGPVPVSSNAPAGGFPVGTTLVTWTAVDSHGNQGWANQQVTITDRTPPTTNLTLTPSILWPPNHRMVAITPSLTAGDLAGPVTVSGPTVTSNEPVDGLVDGDTSPDWNLRATNGIQLRAERDGRGAGRTYTITYVVTDGSGNSTTVSATVMVPTSQGR